MHSPLFVGVNSLFRSVSILAICAAISVVSAQSTPRKLTTVAVMPLQAKGVDATDADVITDAISTQLQQSGTLRVLERAQMDQIMKEQGFQKSGACDGAECALEVGRLLAVDRILVGAAGLVGRTYTLNLRLVSVGTGEVLRSRMGSRVGTIDDVLTDLVPSTVALLLDPNPNAKAAIQAKPAKSSHWGWWLAGGTVAVAGGAAAVILLDTKAPKPSPTAPVTTSLIATW